MLRKALNGALLIGLTLGSSGCLALAAGAGGTVLWQGGKVISEERVTRDRAVEAVKGAFTAQHITLKEVVNKRKATQLRGEYPSGANANVDVLPTGKRSCRIEIRVGLADKSASRELLDEIKNRL